MVVGFSVCKAEAPRNFLRQLSYKVRGSSRSVEGRRSSAIQVSGISRCNRLLVSVGLIYQSVNRSVRGVDFLFEEKSGLPIRRTQDI